MKVRSGFVSNSSSSSFVIAKAHMTPFQIEEFSKFIQETNSYAEYYTDELKHYFVGHGESWDEGQFTTKLKELGVHDDLVGRFDY